MKILTLNCNQCGAPLEVPAKTKSVTCTFCSSRLEVHRLGNVDTPRATSVGQEGSGQVAQNVRILSLKLELDKLDREWISERERHIAHRKSGDSISTKGAARLIGGLFAATGIVFLLFVFGMNALPNTAASPDSAGPAFWIIAIAFIGLGALSYIYWSAKAEAYNHARRTYERRRHELLQQIAVSEQGEDYGENTGFTC